MTEETLVLKEIERFCCSIVEGGTFFQWTWDDSCGAALSTYSSGDSPKVQALLEKKFSANWNYDTLQNAPSHIREFAKDFGGLRAGQQLFCSDPEQDVMILAALWPWNGRDVISIRIWLVLKNGKAHENHLHDNIRKWFLCT